MTNEHVHYATQMLKTNSISYLTVEYLQNGKVELNKLPIMREVVTNIDRLKNFVNICIKWETMFPGVNFSQAQFSV